VRKGAKGLVEVGRWLTLAPRKEKAPGVDRERGVSNSKDAWQGQWPIPASHKGPGLEKEQKKCDALNDLNLVYQSQWTKQNANTQ